MRVLITIALLLCSSIIFYNVFFKPEVSVPAVVYIDKDTHEYKSSENQDNSQDKELEEIDDESEEKVNINSADASEFVEKLKGIGPSIAQRIIEYRESNGPFQDISEIKNVKGIGDKKFEKIENSICVED
jgi:comEA protein